MSVWSIKIVFLLVITFTTSLLVSLAFSDLVISSFLQGTTIQ